MEWELFMALPMLGAMVLLLIIMMMDEDDRPVRPTGMQPKASPGHKAATASER